MNANEAYKLFKKEEPTVKIGRSKFAALHPRKVMPTSSHDLEVCMCKYNQINMILDGLKNILPGALKPNEDLLSEIVRTLEQIKYVDRECKICGITKPLHNMFKGIDEKGATSYYQWENSECSRIM